MTCQKSFFFQTIAALLYNMIPDINQLVIYSTLAVQLKILMAMTAFFYLRWKQPDLHRPLKVPVPQSLFCSTVNVTHAIEFQMTEFGSSSSLSNSRYACIFSGEPSFGCHNLHRHVGSDRVQRLRGSSDNWNRTRSLPAWSSRLLLLHAPQQNTHYEASDG